MSPPRDRRIPDLVSAAEAGEILGVTRQAIQLMANNGQLLGAKVGSTWVFREAEVQKVKKRRDGAPDTAD